VLTRNPDVLLTWDHDTRFTLARTTAGTLELNTTQRGLRYYATCSRTSYAEDLRQLMQDGVVSQSSFLFTIAPGGEDWMLVEGESQSVVRVIHQVGELYDVCVCAAGAYPATDSGVARNMFVEYAIERGYLNPAKSGNLGAAKLAAEMALKRRQLLGVQ
jgi:HK97 family phage prohead protease